MKQLGVLIKPASSACNINCTYCFYRDVVSKKKTKDCGFMSLDTMEKVVKRVFDFVDTKASFIFQGCEPALLGLGFYEKFVDFVRKYNVQNLPVEYMFQTNGLLLDETWLKFFKENNFLIGLSLDGTELLHDYYRKDYSNRETHKRTVEVLECMQKLGVEYNIMQVVTSRTVKHIEEVYEYYKSIGITYLQISPVIDNFNEVKRKREYGLSDVELEKFLITLFDLWYVDYKARKEIRITYFEQIIHTMLGGKVNNCAMMGHCSLQMIIESNGDIYPCDFYATDKWMLGNIQDDSFERIIDKEKSKKFISESLKINENCKKCKWKRMCMGSCKRYKEFTKIRYSGQYCNAYSKFFKHIISTADPKEFGVKFFNV